VTTFAAGFIVLFGLLIVSTCLWSLFKPQWLFEFARPMLEQGWLMFLAVGIRLVLGIALLLVAAAAVALPFIGMTRVKRLIDWVETLPTIAIRLWVVVGIALGGFLLLGVRPLFG
jgi:hypothetical protein